MNNVSKNGKDYKHCIGECDMMQFYLRVLSEKDLTVEKNLVLQQVVTMTIVYQSPFCGKFTPD